MRHLPLACLLSLSVLLTAAAGETAPADFPIWVELDKPHLVTVVIEDAAGVRVRNLVAEMQLPAGKNRLSWDGYDDGKRNAEGDLVRQRVAPGSYRARGLTHDGLKLAYEFTAYGGGNPPWPTKDRTGSWLADHSNALGALFLPANSGSPYGNGAAQVLLTAYVAECGSPLLWVGLDGQAVQRRQVWGWDGANAAARDAGPAAVPELYAYLVLAQEKQISIRALQRNGEGLDVVSYAPIKPGTGGGSSLAVRDGLVVFNCPGDDSLVFADVRTRAILGAVPLAKPRGLAFDGQGRLLAISAGQVLRFTVTRPAAKADGTLAVPELAGRSVLIGQGLDDPRTLAFDPAGRELYVGDHGRSHQVKVFTAEGAPLRTIGRPGDGAQLGLYDELQMQAPLGLAIDDRNQLWVAEDSHLPRRISLWNATTGAFQRAIYGPPGYGGGGTIDPTDKSRMYLKAHYGLIELALDWKTGTAKPKAILVNGLAGGGVVENYGIEYAQSGPSRWGFVNETPTVINGRTYFIGSWAPGLRHNAPGCIWLLGDDHIARPVARIGGNGFAWPPQLNAAFNAKVPTGTNTSQLLTAWSDHNGNHKVDADEWTIRSMPATYTGPDGKPAQLFGIVGESVFPDLSMTANWGVHIGPPTFDAKGVPSWDLSKAELLLPPDDRFFYDEQNRWGTSVWPLADGWTMVGAFSGFRDRKQIWTYPVNDDAPPMRGGDVVHPTRILGVPVKAATGEAGYWVGMNGEKGNMFLITSDGLYLQTLGGDMRNTPLLRFPKAERGMIVDEPGNHVCFEDEHFNPTITQTAQGETYLVAGKEHSSIFRVDGFAAVKRRSFGSVALDAAIVARLPETQKTPRRKKTANQLKVEVGGPEPVVDGNLDDYAHWAGLAGERQASIRLGETHLYAAWRTGDKDALSNDGGDYRFLFKRGGSVDIMLRTDATTERSGKEPVAGDLRLLATVVKGETRAVLYRPVVPGTPAKDRMLFESPVGSVWFDSVVDVSAQVKLVQREGDIELSVPLAVLGLKPVLESELGADLGILRGDGVQTVQRIYWSNADTLIVSDIPSEARFQPANWGRFHLVNHRSVPDTSVRLAPNKARRESKSMQLKKFEENDYAIGFWDQQPDYLAWDEMPVKPGVYEVELTYGCGNTKSNAFIFTSGAHSLSGKAVFTGAWDTYAVLKLGRMTVTGDKASFTLKAVTADAGLMDFRLLRLVPVKP